MHLENISQWESSSPARMDNLWRFPEIGLPLNHPFIDGFSLTKNHPF
jgi:hypothetical protein